MKTYNIYGTGFKSFSLEFNFRNNSGLKKQLGAEYRYKKIEIAKVITNNSLAFSESFKTTVILKMLYSISKPKRHKINNSFILSHIHMAVNRMFSDNQRFEEFKIYYYLENYYKSLIALERRRTN